MYHILVANECAPLLWGIKSILKTVMGPSGCQVEVVTSRSKMFAHISSGKTYDLIIMDAFMGGPMNCSTLEQVRQLQAQTKLIVTTKEDDLLDCRIEIDGTHTLALWNMRTSEDEMFRTIHEFVRLMQREQEHSRAEVELHNCVQNPFITLSDREADVARLLLRGYGILEVGNELSITSSTASTYKSRIFKKLKINNILALSKQAELYGFIAEPFTEEMH